MKTIIISSVSRSCCFTIGRRGENGVTNVNFNFSEWVNEFGPGTCFLYIKRPSDNTIYSATLAIENNIATWTVNSVDTAYEGTGCAELVYVIDEKIAKSVIYKIKVLEDLGAPSATPPSPYDTLIENLTELAVRAETAKNEAEDVLTNAALFEHGTGNESIKLKVNANSPNATGVRSFAIGYNTVASGNYSYAEGSGCRAIASNCHAEGLNTIANNFSQHVFGTFNICDAVNDHTAKGNYIEIVGNGANDNSRSNARTLDWNGNEVLTGGLTVGQAGITIGSTTISEAQLISLLALL